MKDFPFHVLFTDFDDDAWEGKLRKNNLAKLFSYERVHIRVAAKKSVQLKRPTVKLTIDQSDVEEAQIFDFGAEKIIAIRCPSTPRMYVHQRNSTFDLEVILVDSELQ